jgi:hypothetical protein
MPRTTTLKLHCTELQLFDAMQITVEEPMGKNEPEGGLQITSVPTGETVGAKVTSAPLVQVSTVMSGGHRIEGA